MRWWTLLALVVIAGCGASSSSVDAATCATGERACDGTCVDTTSDPANCGDCGVACTSAQECRASSCQVRCDAMLEAPVTDPWGTEWDSVERAAASLDAASASCTGFGGRLPSASELYRVRAGQPGAIAQAADTNPLWSQTPSGRTEQVTVALGGGAIAATTVAAAQLTYRCACAASPAAFGGARCNGPASSPCFALGRLAIDNRDRPPLRKSAAIWECANVHAHLADVPTLVEALQAGLLGSGAQIHTADQSRYDLATTMAWTTATWVASGNTSYLDDATPAPFRCAGWSFATGTNPNPIADEFVGPDGTGYKSEMTDTATAPWTAAHDACTARGGHLARSAELAELIMAGLPGGSDTMLWSSDEVGYNTVDFLAAVLKWAAVDTRYPYDYAATSTITWDYKTTTHPFRCIYYPIDPTYIAPTTCAGSCFPVTLPGATVAMMWFDTTDRVAATMESAIDACRHEGGHVPSERDMTEAVRAGLPNGTGNWLVTTDLAMTNYHIVRWTATEPTFTDQYSANMTWTGPTAAYPYRCMWTNELR